jgi:hypothetical protein
LPYLENKKKIESVFNSHMIHTCRPLTGEETSGEETSGKGTYCSSGREGLQFTRCCLLGIVNIWTRIIWFEWKRRVAMVTIISEIKRIY